MSTARHIAAPLGALTAALLAVACHDGVAPEQTKPTIAAPNFHPALGEAACFRMTGGGRIDKSEEVTGPSGGSKNTPDSRDFATFGFQARPLSCTTTDGTGQTQWTEHNPNAVLGGFSFHGRVAHFASVVDHFYLDANLCGRWSGTGRVHGRDGSRIDGVPFIVEHACDRGEPGRRDHIQICIGSSDPAACNAGTVPYRRNGVLTGGNIQKHRLTGSGA